MAPGHRPPVSMLADYVLLMESVKLNFTINLYYTNHVVIMVAIDYRLKTCCACVLYALCPCDGDPTVIIPESVLDMMSICVSSHYQTMQSKQDIYQLFIHDKKKKEIKCTHLKRSSAA